MMEAPARELLDVLVFEVGGQRYGLPSTDVREIVRAVAITALPQAPAIVEGVIDVRGAVIAVIDVRSRFRRPARSVAVTDHFIVARAGPRLVALRADRAVDLIHMDPTELDNLSETIPSIGHVAGVAKTDDGLVLIHDLRTFLSEAEALSLDRALARTPVLEGA